MPDRIQNAHWIVPVGSNLNIVQQLCANATGNRNYFSRPCNGTNIVVSGDDAGHGKARPSSSANCFAMNNLRPLQLGRTAWHRAIGIALYTRLIDVVVDAAGAGVGANPTVGKYPWSPWMANSACCCPVRTRSQVYAEQMPTNALPIPSPPVPDATSHFEKPLLANATKLCFPARRNCRLSDASKRNAISGINIKITAFNMRDFISCSLNSNIFWRIVRPMIQYPIVLTSSHQT